MSSLRWKRSAPVSQGELVQARLCAVTLKIDLDHIDACLKIFAGDFDPTTIEPKVTRGKSPAGLRTGVGSRTAPEILRETGEPMSSQELDRLSQWLVIA